MAAGYVIALCLEGAGAIGLVFGLWVLHVERRARAAELARFLRSGQIADAPPPRSRLPAITRPTRSIRIWTEAPDGALVDPSHALLALRSAYAAPAR